jgi:adenine-specific DNA-methyltransferase
MGKSKQAEYGQFNTGLNECELTINELKKFTTLQGDVLEPSFGTGNFIKELKKHNLNIDACEIDKKIFKPIKGVNCINCDFLLQDFDKKYDFIIGNPPYIELIYSYYKENDKKKLEKLFKLKGRGRVNLVHLFFDKTFNLIKDGGIIAFLLPSTVLTSPWYNDIRKKIYNEYSVLNIIENIPFKDVSINVCLLILKNQIDPNHLLLEKNDDFYILTKNIKALNKLTLKERGFKCQIGDILWYRVKEDLSDSPLTNKTLIYSNNIKYGELEIGKKLKSKIEGKKQYISNYPNQLVRNCIITPRVIAKKMRHFLLLNNDEYVFENHVLIITHKDVDKLKELNDVILDSSEGFNKFFNSSNLTSTELLNFSY